MAQYIAICSGVFVLFFVVFLIVYFFIFLFFYFFIFYFFIFYFFICGMTKFLMAGNHALF